MPKSNVLKNTAKDVSQAKAHRNKVLDRFVVQAIVHVIISGVTRGLSQGRQSLAEVDPLVTIGGPLAKTQKNVPK